MVTCVWASGELTRLRLVCLGGAPRSAVLFSPPSHIPLRSRRSDSAGGPSLHHGKGWDGKVLLHQCAHRRV